MPHRKAWKSAEAIAWQQNKVLEMLMAGKDRKQIGRKLGISPANLHRYIITLKEGFRREVPSFFGPKGIHWSLAKSRSCENLIGYATKLIRGDEPLLVKKRKVYPPVLPLEKHRKIIAMLKRNPAASSREIAAVVGTTHQTVWNYRQKLVESGLIPKINRSTVIKMVLRKSERITNVLSKGQRQRILQRNKKRITTKAEWLYYKNRIAFDFANILPETIAEELKERLNWKLQIFNPKARSGPEETKLQRFFSFELATLAFDLKRSAWKKYKKITSLEAAEEEAKPLRERIDAPTEWGGITVEKLQEISEALKLNPLKKAVFFGRAAGLTNEQIGNAIGYSKANISLIKKALLPRVEKLLQR